MQREVVYVGGFGFSFVFLLTFIIIASYNFWWWYFFFILFCLAILPTAGYYGYTYVVDEVATVSSSPTALRPDLGDDKEVLLQI